MMRIRRQIIVVIVFALSVSCSKEKKYLKIYSEEERKDQIKTLMIESFEDILSDLNTENMDEYYTNDFLLLEAGLVWNNDTLKQILNDIRTRDIIPKRTNKLEFIDVKISDSTAWVAYQNYATFSIGDSIVRNAHWLESANAILTKKGWRLEMLHSTPVTE